MSITDFPRGSEWRKWDLHLHTPSSYDYGNKSVTNENIIDELSNNDVSVAAITDHHLMDIERIQSLQELGKPKGITILPGIEFLSDARGSQPVHMIGLFSEGCNLEHIWGQIENKTAISKIKGEGKKHNEVYCDLMDTIHLVHELGGLISIHAGVKHSSIETITNSLEHTRAQKTDIALNVDIYELGKPADQIGYIDHVFPHIKKLIPMVICSDNHNIDKYHIKENCWIKADATFEGLKQIICEPSGRVKIQGNKPEEKSGYQVIESIIVDDLNCKQTVLLNPNLNTIIGGRSTGKSTLLKLIAHAINPKIGIIEKHIREIAEQSTSVRWQDGEENKIRDIEFFPQSHMYDIARDVAKKDRLIEGIVKEKDTDAVLEDYESFCASTKSILQTNIDNLFKLQAEQSIHKKQLKEKGDKEGLEKEIANVEIKIKQAHDDDFSKGDLEKYETIKKTLLVKEQLLARIKKDKHEIELLKEDGLFDQSLTYKFNSLSDDTAKVIEQVFIKIKENALKEWKVELSKQMESLGVSEKSLQKEVEEIKEATVFKKGEIHQAQNKQYSELSERLKNERKNLDNILFIQKQIEALESQKDKLFSQVVDNHLAYSKKIKTLISGFGLEHEDIKITIERVFREKKCASLLGDFINLQISANKELVDDWTHQYDKNTKQKVESFLSNALNGSIVLKSYKEMKDLTKGLLTENWYSISYKLTYENDTFEKMSDGKKAFVILKLLLEFSDKEGYVVINC